MHDDTIQDAITLLASLGYTVEAPAPKVLERAINPVVREAMEALRDHAETWENYPEDYAEAIEERRPAFRQAINLLDLEALFDTWSDDTLGDIVEAGSDLCFNKLQRLRARRAAERILARRYPPVIRETHGMVE
jgi:predicted lipoprotein